MGGTFWILIIIGILVWGYCIKKGSEQGLVQSLNSVLTLICAAVCYNLASGLAANYSSGNVSSALTGILLLVVVVCAYGVFHVIFSSIHIFSRLPVIKILDNILGVFGGFIEGAVVLYLADAILRYFVKA
jgi:uncharacterized membrane protein required for colicin V production